MKNWSIQRRVLFIALLPAALIALALSAYHARTRINEIEATTVAHARALARQLAPLSELGVLSGNRELLRTIVRSALEEDRTLARVAIIGAQGEALAVAPAAATEGPDPGTAARPDAGGPATVSQPIRRTLPGGIDGPAGPAPPAVEHGATIGHVVLQVDLAPVRSEQLAVALESLAITGLALALTALVALRIGRGVTGPVQQLTRTVGRIRGGELGALPATDSGGELGSLEQGVTAMAQEIERTHASMRERVDATTRELQQTLTELEDRNRDLEAARLEAEAASEFKSRFLANVSHEIRTPMNSILGFTELLQQAELDPIHADYLATVHSSAQSLLTLLNGILDLSKMESDRMELEPVDTDLNTLLLDVFQLLAPHAFNKGVEFIVTPVDAAMARVHADPVRLKQVLINLASNAVKFTERGHVRMSGAATTRTDGGVTVTFCVEDTGCGIPAEAQARLFQAFAQGQHTRPVREDTEAVAGTGLGLHIASEIVFLMGGLIEFQSEPGSGSAFWFTLELEAPDAPAVAPVPPWPRRRILYLDADTATRTAYTDMLARAAVDTDAAGDAATRPPDPARHEAIAVHLAAERVTRGAIEPVDAGLAACGLPLLAHCHAHTPGARQAVTAAGYMHILPKTPDPAVLRMAVDRAVDGDDALHPGAPITDTVPADAPGGGLRVLVVDDHPLNLKLLESYLAQPGIEVVTATGSDAALQECRARGFDAILMDIHLPGRDGLATAGRIRADDGPNRDTPIIAITADAFAEQSQRALHAGMSGVLVKPISRPGLMQELAAWCGPWTAAAAAPDPGARAAPGDDPPVVDERAALERAGGRPEVMQELFGILCRSLPDSRDALAAARERGDTDAVGAAAHRLRGAAVYCAVPRLEDAVTEVEWAARAGDRAALDTALARLYAAIEELLAHARRHAAR